MERERFEEEIPSKANSVSVLKSAAGAGVVSIPISALTGSSELD